MDTFSLINLIGGACLLFYGVQIVSDELQSLTGDKFRQILSTFTSTPLKGLFTGTLVTAIVQSSTVTAVVLVTLVNAGVMTFQQTLAVILGAGIGGTVTIQLIAFRIFDYAMLMIAVGLLIKLLGQHKVMRCLGNTILGFGFIFFSLQLITQAVKPLGSNLLFKEVLIALAKSPFYGIIIAMGFTALVQNSAVTMGIIIALAMQNLVTLTDAMPLIFGTNIGICAVTMISAIGGKPDAKRVAETQTLFKSIGVLLFLPFMHQFIELIQGSTSDTARQIANAHTLFNLIIACLFLPFGKLFSQFAIYLIPDKKNGIDPSAPKYLDENILTNPSLALGESIRESLRMGDIVIEMFRAIIPAFTSQEEEKIKAISKKDDYVDSLNTAIKLYITKLSQRTLSPEQSKRQINVLSAITNFENIGDIIDKNLMELALKRIKLGVHFSEQGWQEIQQLHKKVMENLESVITAYASRDTELANKVLENKPIISQLERTLRQAHIDRLREGLRESIETSEIHLDILTNLKRIDSHIAAIAYAVLDK